MLYVPECGHLVELSQLDLLNLNSVYEVAADGSVLSQNSNVWPHTLQESRCTCGMPCTSTRRYMQIAKLFRIANILDRLVGKVGSKVHGFAMDIDAAEQELAKNFDSFVKEIRPNPLAAQANIALLLRRDRGNLDLRKHIVCFRDEVIGSICSNIDRLHETFPNLVPSYALLFDLHFGALEYRIMAVRIADTLRLANHLVGLQDPSLGVLRQGLKMMAYAHSESLACVNFCQEALNNELIKTSPAIEAEIRLRQVQFGLFANATQSKLSELGVVVRDTPSVVNETIKANLKAVMSICEQIPAICGSLATTAEKFSHMTEENSTTTLSIPRIKLGGIREHEKLWSQHEVGHLKTCDKHHPYSAKTFARGCPECGKHVMTTAEIYNKTSKHLFEDQFLKAMHAATSSRLNGEAKGDLKGQPGPRQASMGQTDKNIPRVAEEMEPRKAMKQEQKFLEVMHQRLSSNAAASPISSGSFDSEGFIGSEMWEERLQDKSSTEREENGLAQEEHLVVKVESPTLVIEEDDTALWGVKQDQPELEKQSVSIQARVQTNEERFLEAMRKNGRP